MKKSGDLLGLPIIDLETGRILGRVKHLVIDAEQKAVVALVLDDGQWYLAAKLLLFTDLVGIGNDAVTINSSSVIKSVADCPVLEKWLAADLNVKGAKVMSKSGSIYGEVVEFTLDRSGRLVAYEIKNAAGEVTVIPAARIIALGKDIVIIDGEPFDQQATAITCSATTEKEDASVSSTLVHTYVDDREKLLGRRAGHRIETDTGVVIVEQGEAITEEVVQKARLAGKYQELLQDVQ